MKWVTRGLWITAWGAWVWCGFGLARELPRHPTIVKSKLELEEHEWLCGYLAGGVAVSCTKGDTEDPIRYRTWDASTGHVIHDWKGPLHPSWEMLRLGFVAGVNKDSLDSKTEFQPFQILDLGTGAWT